MRPGQQVAVVGGGIAGLTAAIYAAQGGARVTLFESVSQLGGRARTHDEQGFLLNQGPHALYCGGAAGRVLGELGIAVPGAAPQLAGTFALAAGRLHALPVGLASLLTSRLLGPAAKLEAARFLASLRRPVPSELDALPLSEYLERELRHPRVRQLVGALVRLTSYSHAPGQISAGAALAQMGLSQAGVRYLDGGWQSLVDALAARARAQGVEIRTGARVRGVSHGRGEPLRLCLSGDTISGDAGLRVDAAVLCVPPREANRLLGERAAELASLERDTWSVRVACLDLGLRALPRPRHRFLLGIDTPIYYSVHSAAARLAPPDGALVHVARYLEPDERIDQPQLRAELEAVLDRLQPGWRPLEVVRRELPNLCAASAGVSARQRGLAGRPGPALRSAPGIFLAGDWVGPEGQLADASFASGRAAGQLASALRAGSAAA